ncbi:CU044_5270 family protein [Actinoplanes derwentensis]|uniref:CU044_5270 family protein n=1 Tax=Actinoplanes derwentensis TaxID=113562 RepID=A0A1H1RH82_9ACTN|nr:CU044_5270 family protein [Actinoplanes derwentensis]GID89401.1 hypothetical protein Ade03nite_83250 [Actinoplanes derwentensis]SDS35157.1 hypothetical protein SAMN04489716_0591 [Actinoplanes derwentensis]
MTDDLDVAINDLYPVPEGGIKSLRRVRARVVPQPRRLLRWPYSAAAAVVLAVAVIVVVVRGGAPDGAMVEVAQTLNTAADAQIRTVDEPVPAGKYRYIATHAMDTGWGPAPTLFGSRVETWVPADPSGVWFRRVGDTGERIPLTGSTAAGGPGVTDERLSGPCGRFRPGEGDGDMCLSEGSWQVPTAVFIAGLPRDPEHLFDRLRSDTDGHGSDGDQEVLVYAADALRSGLLPADLRAAIYRALTRLSALKITERAATLDGHTGTALGVTGAGQRQEIVIDPETGVFIGERKRLSEETEGVKAGTMVGSSTVIYGIADEPWQRPAN